MRVPVSATATSKPTAPDTTDAPNDNSDLKLLRSTILIPGRGYPIPNGVVITRGTKIEWVGSMLDVPSKYRKLPTAAYAHCLMPGLWDCHVHFFGLDVAASFGTGLQSFLPGHAALVGAITVDDLRATLMAGYTSVRELGGFGADVQPAIEKGVVVGPNLYGSVAAISTTGGHGDDHACPLDLITNVQSHGSAALAVCDGVDDCIKTVRRMVRRGAKVIKVCSSGGVLSLNDDPECQQFSHEELSAIVQEAARSKRAVAAHAIGKAGIMAALRAGVTSIEHGIYLDEEVADLMVEKGTYFVGTQHIIRTLFSDYMNSLPEPSKQKLLHVYGQAAESYKIAIKKGVKIAMGTDMVSSARNSRLSHGNNGRELAHAVELGMSTLKAIESATANGPETLGPMAPLSGQLKAGYDADIIGVSHNPLDNIAVLGDANNITHVWKGGQLFKKPQLAHKLEGLSIDS